jgi:hypothetical protein
MKKKAVEVEEEVKEKEQYKRRAKIKKSRKKSKNTDGGEKEGRIKECCTIIDSTKQPLRCCFQARRRVGGGELYQG